MLKTNSLQFYIYSNYLKYYLQIRHYQFRTSNYLLKLISDKGTQIFVQT